LTVPYTHIQQNTIKMQAYTDQHSTICVFAKITVTRLSFVVHEEVPVSALNKNVTDSPTAMIPQTKPTAVSYSASVTIE